MAVLKVTLDTNVLGQPVFQRIEEAIEGLPIELAHISVTAREQEDAYQPPPGLRISEIGVWDESRWDEAVYGGEAEAGLFEDLLKTVSNGSFPPIGKRDNLRHGERNQLRDVMILIAHYRSGRNIFVTNETRAFGKKDSQLRRNLEALCATKIMNVEEFVQRCDELREEGAANK